MKKSTMFLILAVLVFGFLIAPASAADGEIVPTFAQILFAPAIGAGIYGALWWYNKNRKEGEPFDWVKFRPTLIMGIVLSVILFFTGASEITQFMVSDLLDQWMPIVDNSGILTLIFSSGLFGVVIGWFDQFVKGFGGSHGVTEEKKTSAANPESPVSFGTGKINGIYGGSASGKTPAKEFTSDVNQVPTVFVEIESLTPGPATIQLVIDNVIQREFMPDQQGKESGLAFKFGLAGEKIPFPFIIDQKYRTTEKDHEIAFRMGRFGASGKVEEWYGLQRFPLKFTGTKFQE